MKSTHTPRTFDSLSSDHSDPFRPFPTRSGPFHPSDPFWPLLHLIRRMTSIAALRGELPLDVLLNATVVIKKGKIQENPRNGTKHSFKFLVDEGFDVLKAKCFNYCSLAGHLLGTIQEGVIYFKGSKKAMQSQYTIIDSSSFQEKLLSRWSKISDSAVVRWREEGKEPINAMTFEFFIYVPTRLPRTNERSSLQRATAARIQAAATALCEFENNNDVRFGDITRNHLEITNARSVTENIVVPTDNTTQQAMHLDETRARQQREEEAQKGQDEF